MRWILKELGRDSAVLTVAGSSFHHCGARTEKSCEVEWPSTSLRWQYQRAAEVVDRSARPGTWGLTMLGGIWSAAMDGDIDRVKSLMKKGIDPNLRDSSNYTALHYASRSGHLAVCQFLLQSGACASPQTLGGATPLHRSAYCGHLDVVRLLLQYRADPLRCDDDGASPLHKAAERGHGEVCELLLHNCPALRSHANKKLQLPHQVAPEGPLQELLRPII